MSLIRLLDDAEYAETQVKAFSAQLWAESLNQALAAGEKWAARVRVWELRKSCGVASDAEDTISIFTRDKSA